MARPADPVAFAELSPALDAMKVGLQLVDRQWRYVYVNPAAAEHGRTSREALLGRTMMECYPGIDETEMFATLRRVRDGGEPTTLENRFVYPDGQEGWFELRIEPSPSGVLIVSIDATERKKTEQQLRHAQKMDMMGRLAGGIAHDFNNLLTVIQLCGSFALDYEELSSSVRAELDQILATVQRAAALTRQLLTFSSAAPAQPAALRAGDAVRDMERMLRRLLTSEIDLLCAPASDAPVWIDRGQLEQVIVNLVVNARDAMPRGGQLTIETSEIHLEAEHLATRRITIPPGDYVVLSVTDTGCGMTPEVQERAFEPFFTTKHGEGGTGLGLATCWGIVRQAGGYLWPYSEVGHGTTFRVYLPRVDCEPAAPPAPAPCATPRGSGRVLLVEDNPDVRAVVARALESQGFETVAVATPAEALARCEEEGFSLLLVDMVLPTMSGPDLVAEIARRRPGLPIVYISGYTERSLARLPLLQGAVIIDKPFEPARLAARIREALDRHHEESRSTEP